MCCLLFCLTAVKTILQINKACLVSQYKMQPKAQKTNFNAANCFYHPSRTSNNSSNVLLEIGQYKRL